MWTRELVLERKPPIPVLIDGCALPTAGRIIPEGNNPWIVVDNPHSEARFSWSAILASLNDLRSGALPMAPGPNERRPYTPSMF